MAFRNAGGFGGSKKSGSDSKIPTASLADIAFLLLIFFMVTTVFRRDTPRPIEWTEAEATEQVDEKRQNILHLWVEEDGDIFINDQLISTNDVANVVRPIYSENRQLIVAIRADRQVPYQQVNSITEQLQASGAVRVNFATRVEQRVTRPRR